VHTGYLRYEVRRCIVSQHSPDQNRRAHTYLHRQRRELLPGSERSTLQINDNDLRVDVFHLLATVARRRVRPIRPSASHAVGPRACRMKSQLKEQAR